MHFSMTYPIPSANTGSTQQVVHFNNLNPRNHVFYSMFTFYTHKLGKQNYAATVFVLFFFSSPRIQSSPPFGKLLPLSPFPLFHVYIVMNPNTLISLSSSPPILTMYFSSPFLFIPFVLVFFFYSN